jgi:hypothetical protein
VRASGIRENAQARCRAQKEKHKVQKQGSRQNHSGAPATIAPCIRGFRGLEAYG